MKVEKTLGVIKKKLEYCNKFNKNKLDKRIKSYILEILIEMLYQLAKENPSSNSERINVSKGDYLTLDKIYRNNEETKSKIREVAGWCFIKKINGVKYLCFYKERIDQILKLVEEL